MISKHKKIGLSVKVVVLLAAIITSAGLSTKLVLASHLNGQINELNQQNSENAQTQEVLEVEAASLSDKISRLQAEIDGLQKQIQENQAKSDELQRQIDAKQKELDKEKDLLGQNIRQMYLEGDISTIEMLATSKNLSDFLDKQQYREVLQNEIKSTLDAINTLKAELDSEKSAMDKLIVDQKAIQERLDGQRAEQARLLSLNQSQQAAYEQQIKSNNSRIAELQRQQAAENASIFGSTPGTGVNCGGGYPGSASGPWGPWGCNYPLDYNIDNWGMYNRECVSYTAFKVAASGRHMPYWGGRGNAKQWDDNARATGIPVDSNPRAGDIGISNSGQWGHAFYVEQVSGDGSIYISDYNQQFDGRYREYWISASTVRARGFVFIHF